MRRPTHALVPTSASILAIAAFSLSHAAAWLGQGLGLQLACAAIQAMAVGAVIAATAPPPWRWLGAIVPAVLLTGIAAGARHHPATGLLVAAGLSHAMLYTALFAIFARSLAPDQDALVTRMARLANPNFHPGMVLYTRRVTAAWAALFATQIAASMLLLDMSPHAWQTFVSGWHLAALPALMVAELLVRHVRFRHEHPTGLRATLKAIRAVRRPKVQVPAANRSTIP